MIILNRLYSWYGKLVVNLSLAAVILLLIVGVVFHIVSKDTVEEVVEVKLPVVTVATIASLESQSSFAVTGTVSAISEARLQTETGGRVTSVSVQLGDAVKAGAVLATIENASERAALLQAEGAYDAAVASSQQGTAALSEAENSVKNAYRDAFTASDTVVRSLVEELFSNPRTMNPSFRMDGNGNAPTLNDTLVSIETMLTEWSINASMPTADAEALLVDAEANVRAISDFVATLSLIVSEEDANSVFTEADLALYKTRFAGARASLDGTLASLSGVRSNYEQTVIAASNVGPSLSDAQIKSALGTLRAAQANYEKTLVRTPISGVVNAIYIKAGEYVSPSAPAVIVANNNALVISTMLGANDADVIELGEEVRINDVTTGIVTEIAPAVDPISGKKEIKITASDDAALENGSTVSVAFQRAGEDDGMISVPLAALKITASGPVAFSVSSENTLVVNPVVLGPILGDMVIIEKGLTKDSVIVVDVRGLQEGEKVEISK